MSGLEHLFEHNRKWAASMTGGDPEFFARLAKQQRPDLLWIGCSDSRIPANQVIGLAPGEVFVHRNVANQVAHGDLNCLSVLQYAVEFLGVRHIVVCGHYGCGGVRAAMDPVSLGLCDHWLAPIRDLVHAHRAELDRLEGDAARYDRVVELNVVEQARRVARSSIVQAAWAKGRFLKVHSWVYRLEDGIIHDLEHGFEDPDRIGAAYRLNPPVPPAL